MKRRASSILGRAGMVCAGFLTMVIGMGLGTYMAEARNDRQTVHGTRRDLVLHLARTGPRPMRQAAMAAMADGVLTAREERHLYMVADQIRRLEMMRAREERESDARDAHGDASRDMI